MDAYLLPPQAQASVPQARPLTSAAAHAAGPVQGSPPRAPPAPAPLLVPPVQDDDDTEALPVPADDGAQPAPEATPP
jgi:hypothetical protein